MSEKRYNGKGMDQLDSTFTNAYMQGELSMALNGMEREEIRRHQGIRAVAEAVCQGWIRVKDRLPDNIVNCGERLPEKPYVLCVDSRGRTSVGYPIRYSYGVRFIFSKPIGDPTHWMPLPDSPQETTND